MVMVMTMTMMTMMMMMVMIPTPVPLVAHPRERPRFGQMLESYLEFETFLRQRL